MADCRCRLAAFVGAFTFALAGLKRAFMAPDKPKKISNNPNKYNVFGVFFGIMVTMKSVAELEHLNLDPAAQSQIAAMLQALMDQVERDSALIKAKDFKIEALTYEIAHLRRMRYGVKSEALAPEQRDVFEETWTADLAAIEAEIEHLNDADPARALLNLNAHAPVVSHYPPICRALSIAMSPNPVPAGSAATV